MINEMPVITACQELFDQRSFAIGGHVIAGRIAFVKHTRGARGMAHDDAPTIFAHVHEL